MPFGDDVRAGLGAQPKTLPAKYFYDDLGSVLFEAICLLPEYYLTRAEAQIFNAHGQEMIDALRPVRLVELGSGSATKTRILLDAAFRRHAQLEYIAIDISKSALESAQEALEAEYPALSVRGYALDYAEGLQLLSDLPSAPATLALFLGSNIGNFEPPQAQRLLQSIRAVLQPGDGLLLGTDLKKDRATLEAAYDDPIGLTAAFNLNILARINRELGGEFDLRSFRHRAHYNEQAGRVEMHLQSTCDQRAAIRSLALTAEFRQGETIHTESSYKFDDADISELAAHAGFDVEKTWKDEGGQFACSLLRASARH